jgi:hypothetical protein
VVHREDRPGAQQVCFAGDDWLGYVPIRASDTICVQERLPAGAAGVLINQTHSYCDLYLAISSAEKRLFDAIDGEASIGEILQRTAPSARSTSHSEATRTFFERLWWHDQLVIDASHRPAGTPAECRPVRTSG